MERTYQFEYTKEHFRECQKYLGRQMYKARIARLWAFPLLLFAWLTFFAFVGVVLFGYHFAYQFSVPTMAGSLNLFFICGVTWLIISHLLHKSLARLEESVFDEEPTEITLQVSDLGVFQRGAKHHLDVSWKDLWDVVETPNLVLFLTGPATGISCPRISIPENEYGFVLDFSRARIGNR
jgi:hypothetical protein